MSYGLSVNGEVQHGQGLPERLMAHESGAQSAEPVNGSKLQDTTLLILDKRPLDRECFAECLRSHGIKMEVHAFASLRDWRSEEYLHPPIGAILVNIGSRRMSDPPVTADLNALAVECAGTPLIVMADNDDLDQVLLALQHGARAFIPTSVVVPICAEAIALAVAGGSFVPASSLVGMRGAFASTTQSVRPSSALFTLRQEEVARALRRGKANKIIAYELNLRESTVKVHIRNIMKKLRASNRTEVAYKISEMLPE